MGVELISVPMCDWCRVETEGQDEDQVLEKGLDYVSNFDGGWSRSRKKKLGEEAETLKNKPKRVSRVLVKTPSRPKEQMEHERRRIRLNRSARDIQHQVVLSIHHKCG